MKRSIDRILTTHVGSLVRPAQIREVMAAREQELPYDQASFPGVLRKAVADVVREQAETGIDIVSDGEFGKTGWIRYVAERMNGFVHRELRPGEDAASNFSHGGEAEKFPEFYAAYGLIQSFDWVAPGQPEARSRNDAPKPAAKKIIWECVGPISYRGGPMIEEDVLNLKAALAAVNVQDAFMPVAAPNSARGLWLNSHYANEDAVLTDLAAALGEEYRAIVDAGFILQVDDAFLADQYAKLRSTMGEKDIQRHLESRIDLLNHALQGIPEDKIRYHVCWGSWNGPHTTDVPLRTLAPLILKVKAQAYALEAANPRHEHEWQVWKDVKLPDGKVLIPGLVSHCTNVVEHPELVAWRIANFASVVGRENIIAGTDCGFSQSYNHMRVHPSIQWAKLKALVEGARLASRELWRK